MKNLYPAFLTIVLGFFLIIGEIPSSYAQESDIDEFTLEEIVVTADKREQDLQETAMSISAITGDDIIEKQISNTFDLLKDVINVSVTETGGMGASIAIRGLGQDLPIGVGEPSVSTNYDGVYSSRNEIGLFGYFDVDRVEVLRGPQGTLYGRNATGGVINVVSKKPEINVIEGFSVIEFGNYGKFQGQGAINVPINDTLAARVAFATSKQDGFMSDNGGSQSGKGARLQIRYLPSDDVSVTLLSNYTRSSRTGSALVSAADFNAGDYFKSASAYPWNNLDNYRFDSYKFTLTTEFTLGPGIVTFIPSYQHDESMSAGYVSYLDAVSFTYNPWGMETITGELRYTSKPESNIIWTIGLYGSKTDDPDAPGPDAGEEWANNTAAFGQITYPFTDTLRGVAGGRMNVDKKGYTNYNVRPEFPTQTEFKFSYFDWKVGIEKDFSETVMSYLTMATGHRSGGYEQMYGDPFDEETALSYELGLKSRFIDDRLQLNGDFFYYDYTDYQHGDMYMVEGETEPRGRFVNIPKVKNYGAEMEANALIGDATFLNLSLAWLHTRFDCDWHVSYSSTGEYANVNGQPLPHAPDFTFKGGLEHTFSFSSGSSLKPTISARWTDEQYVNMGTDPEFLQEAYTIVDASLTYNWIENWSLIFYTNNVMDKIIKQGAVGEGDSYFPGNPRQFGVTFNMKF